MPIQGGMPILMDTNDDVSGLSDAEVELRAIEAIPPIPFGQLTERDLIGTFYSAQHSPISPEPWPPLPANMGRLPIWDLGDGIFLLDDRLLNYNLTPIAPFETGGGRMRAMSGIDPPGGGGGSTNMQPMGFTPPNYGTNLWISQYVKSSGNMIGTVSNTISDILYEVQSRTDLLQTNWNSEGFIYGSELTNWTAFSMGIGSPSNLFLRIRSWQDDGSGLPLWWQLQYFGQTGVDPYGNPAGDGWNNLQKFQNGMNPNLFYTPPTPQGVTVSYNPTNGTATVSWLPSPGSVTNYTVNFNGTDYNVAAGVNSLTEAISLTPWDILWSLLYGTGTYFNVQANYAGGSSPQSSTSLSPDYPNGVNVIPYSQGSVYLVASPSTLPPGTTAIRLIRIDPTAEDYYGDYSFDTNWDIPISAFTNGLYLIPTFMQAAPVDSYGQAIYEWWVGTVGTGGIANSLANPLSNCMANSDLNYNDYFGDNYGESDNTYDTHWLMTPFFDGRAQLKQNLIFLLRAGLNNLPFQFTELYPDVGNIEFTKPTNYAYASFYSFYSPGYPPAAGVYAFLPFGENYLYRNFVFNVSDADPQSGRLTSFTNLFSGVAGLALNEPPTYLFQLPTTNGVSIPSLLATNQTRWLFLYLPPYNGAGYNPIGIIQSGSTNQMSSNVRNTFGLQFLSTEIAYGTNGSVGTYLLNPGYSTTQGGYFYSETAQPQFQTVEYDFWNPNLDSLPGMTNFLTTNTSRLMITDVGNPNFFVAGYAKLAVQNGYSGVYGYLGQYFTNAYQIDTNGVVTTNTTGILSPYGYFFPTNPGPVALVTMPDIDTGARGTCIVYAASIQLDKNHDTNMDLSFNGVDATSQSSPMAVWVNNGLIIPGTGGNLDHNVQVSANSPRNFSYGKITCQRDLENFFRLWICGVPSLPSSQGYSVTLSCSAISGSPAINLYTAETNGSTLYLTSTNVAQSLVNETKLGTISSSSTYTFPNNFFNGSNKCFLFEGAGIGEGQFTLTIYKNGNIIAQTSAFIDLHDIKDLYEQAHIANVLTTFPNMVNTTNASTFVSDHALADNSDETKQFIVFVHGWRMGIWDYQDFSDTMFKRLYWAGYQGRFAALRWPTLSADDFKFFANAQSYLTYNRSEHIAFDSGAGTCAYLDYLKSRFPDYSINVAAHSMGNVVMMEALKDQLAEGHAVIDNYVLMQAAVPAHCYQTNLPDYSAFTAAENNSHTPDIYRGYPGNIAGAVNNQIVNFFNTNDFALATGTLPAIGSVSWEGNQVNYKPDWVQGYTSDGTNCFHDVSDVVTNAHEKMAFVARPRSKAAGAREGVAGEIGGGEVDLKANYGFDRNADEHSAEFNWNIQQLGDFYKQLGISLKVIQPPTP